MNRESGQPHVIRLRAPWKQEVTEAPTAVTGMGNRTTRFVRMFQLPTGLTPRDSVCLVCGEWPGEATVMLNDRVLGSIPAGQPRTAFSVLDCLVTRNRLVIAAKGNWASEPTLRENDVPGPVWLEILPADAPTTLGIAD